MKKSLIAVSLLAAISSNAFAADDTTDKYWIGGFTEIYKPDEDKFFDFTSFDAGLGFGAEVGVRESEHWGGRLEVAKVSLESDANLLEDTATRFGIDAMYFLEDDLMYIFGGLKHIDMVQSGSMANVGLGKHWDLSDKVKLVTEVAAYHDFGQAYNDISAKLGLAYTFGATAPKAPGDADQDGVNDNLDQCPNTAIGARVDSSGCNVDLDGDGVLNGVDMCPNTPAGTRVDSTGCNWDKDMDGVANDIDKCPDTPKGTVVGAKGCSLEIDSDQDGVLDNVDECADTPLTDKVNATGCSIFEEVEVRETLKVTFANNSSVIENPKDPKFQEFADFLNRFPDTHTAIEGHASAPGRADYNMSLSLKRARAVRQLLIDNYGIDASRLSAEGFGETKLLDTSNTAEAHKVNRRIEAVVTASKKEKVLR
ncbi:OmpA family protein [Aliiglaciecola lipolytica]|uniref:OmpA-OmpF porin, OOP family n=1 Tax=Aliiglaciecola lipolytica E3 TaxID=1127673 RepID=K6YAG1_9ALTE|nr:OmpA family protein [Aliiglaciecola lipolytica]GAC13653.1 OmpA-OmpF porin, OOP family [Aliiglaciecola lipolytica E3]